MRKIKKYGIKVFNGKLVPIESIENIVKDDTKKFVGDIKPLNINVNL